MTSARYFRDDDADMNEIIQKDVVVVGGGDGRRGEARRPLSPLGAPSM